MTLNRILLILTLLAFASNIYAQDQNGIQNTAPLVYAKQYVIHSSILNEDRKINVSLPEHFHESSINQTYPVLLLLENEFFLMTSGVVKHLSSVERMPEVIIVSLVDGPIVPKLYTNGMDNSSSSKFN